MTVPTNVGERRTQLAAELEHHAIRMRTRADQARRKSGVLMALGLLCSIAAALLGFFTSTPAKVVGGIALLPPLIAFIAVNMKLDGQGSWFARKSNALQSLRLRLLYQLPLEPTADHIAVVANAYGELNIVMQKEWDETLRFNWSGLSREHPTSQSTESSTVPNPVGLGPAKK
jgi:hypothetical protein